MTKLLEIKGTNIRVEIERCGDCPCMDGEWCCCCLVIEGGLRNRDDADIPWPIELPDWCPLPERL